MSGGWRVQKSLAPCCDHPVITSFQGRSKKDIKLILKRLEVIKQLMGDVPDELLSIFDGGERCIGYSWDGFEFLTSHKPKLVLRCPSCGEIREVRPR